MNPIDRDPTWTPSEWGRGIVWALLILVVLPIVASAGMHLLGGAR